MAYTDASGSLARRRRYRRLFVACILAGTLGLFVASSFDYHLLGVGVYWAGALAALVVWRGTSVALLDERDVALERRASQLTLLVVAVVGIVAIPAVVASSELGYYATPPEVDGAILSFVGLFVVFGVVYGWLRFRP